MDGCYLFRGKRVSDHQWVKGSLAVYDISIRGHETAIIAEKSWWTWKEKETGRSLCGNLFRVHPHTVGQFTGLIDKNGEKIFEGDIYRYPNPNYGYGDPNVLEYIVETVPKIHELYASSQWDGGLNYAGTEIEVIGNIWDNPACIHETLDGICTVLSGRRTWNGYDVETCIGHCEHFRRKTDD